MKGQGRLGPGPVGPGPAMTGPTLRARAKGQQKWVDPGPARPLDGVARPELSAHSEAIALKRAEDAKRLADQQQLEEQNSTPSGAQSLSFSQAVNVRAVTPAKRSRDEPKALSSDAEDNSGSSISVLEKPKSR